MCYFLLFNVNKNYDTVLGEKTKSVYYFKSIKNI